jgi:anti-sigma B factor antagonist
MEWNIVELADDSALVELHGRMDIQGALKADPAFVEIAGRKRNLIVDASDLEFLASLGIRTLVSTSKALAAKDGRMVLLAPPANVEQVLRTSGIDTIIPIVQDRAAADAAVRLPAKG